MDDCKAWLSENNIELMGIEICDGAEPVNTHPFKGDSAFLLGNEGDGLSEKLMSYCDRFVYIPQYGDGTASLNVTVAGSIVLHNFASWAEKPERERQGAKFVVGKRPHKTSKKGQVPLTDEELAALRSERAAKRAAKESNVLTSNETIIGGSV